MLGIQTQVLRFVPKHFYLLSHFPSPLIELFGVKMFTEKMVMVVHAYNPSIYKKKQGDQEFKALFK